MKTIITIIISLFCMLLNAQNETPNLEIDIRGRDCNGGLSFCTIETTSISKNSSTKYSLQKVSETELQFIINTNELTIEEQKNIFGKEIQYISEKDIFYFNQKYDFELNYNSCKTLGLNSKNLIIKSDSYPIKLIDNRAIILLKLGTKI